MNAHKTQNTTYDDINIIRYKLHTKYVYWYAQKVYTATVLPLIGWHNSQDVSLEVVDPVLYPASHDAHLLAHVVLAIT